jgi:phosphoglycolate phosphatase
MATSKHIVFDWNCTLLDDFHALYGCTNILLENAGHEPVTPDGFRHAYHVPFEIFYRNLGLSETQAERMMSLENSMFHDHYEPLAEQAPLRAGATEILEHVRANGLHSYILSNHLVYPIRTQLQRLNIDHHFVEVLAYANRAVQFKDMSKGERLRRYRVDKHIAPEDVLIVGDTPEEIHIAREQGLISVAITGGCASETRLRSENPNHIIHSLHELPSILEERGFVS